MRSSDILIFVPTFNEQENVEPMCIQLLAVPIDSDIVFVDDNSPDGTGEILDRLAAENPRVTAHHRSGKLGIGSAHLYGISYAYELGYKTLITLDCDFTHEPSDIPRLMETAAHADIALGSRFHKGDNLPNWNIARKFLTYFGHFLTKSLLQISQDATGAFRVYNLETIPKALFDKVQSRGYSFFFESLFLFVQNGYRVRELPINLPARVYGHSKMTLRDTLRSARYLLHLSCAKFINPDQFLIGPELPPCDPSLVDPHEWDSYWSSDGGAASATYAVIASLFRKTFIKHQLTSTIRTVFPHGARLLHAGCGSGQVDTLISDSYRITALDISFKALRLYAHNNPRAEAVKHASIFDLPFEAGAFDGVYNLGVMEHFTGEQIRAILSEFHRVLKPGGKLVLFWPHNSGSSVRVLKAMHWFAHRIPGKKSLSYHPPEISLLKGKQDAVSILGQSSFTVSSYRFDARDLFVQAVIVAVKSVEP